MPQSPAKTRQLLCLPSSEPWLYVLIDDTRTLTCTRKKSKFMHTNASKHKHYTHTQPPSLTNVRQRWRRLANIYTITLPRPLICTHTRRIKHHQDACTSLSLTHTHTHTHGAHIVKGLSHIRTQQSHAHSVAQTDRQPAPIWRTPATGTRRRLARRPQTLADPRQSPADLACMLPHGRRCGG